MKGHAAGDRRPIVQAERLYLEAIRPPFLLSSASVSSPSKERTSDYTQAATRIADPESIDL